MDSGRLDARTMARKAKGAMPAKAAVTDAAVAEIVDLVEVGRRHAARTINATMTAVYWAIGRRIVLDEQHGTRRAEYGEALIRHVAARLTARVWSRIQHDQSEADAQLLHGLS